MQAQITAERIAQQWRPMVVYTSPLRRCVQTGAAIAAACAASTAVLEDLSDLHYGDWQWQTHEHVKAQWPDLFERWHDTPELVRFPGGESLQDLVARIANVVRLIVERHTQQTVVVVGHESGNRALLLQALDEPLSAYWRLVQDPCAVSEVEWQGSRVTVRRVNETQHLLTV